jgi:hypothetical protein
MLRKKYKWDDHSCNKMYFRLIISICTEAYYLVNAIYGTPSEDFLRPRTLKVIT